MSLRFRFLIGVATVLNTILIVLAVGLVRSTQADLRGLQDVLATKADLVAVSGPEIELFHEGRCTGCHTERRFAGDRNTRRAGIGAAVAHMGALPDAGLSEQDLQMVHASLDLLRCTACHEVDRLKGLALSAEESRMETIRRMISMPGSNISPDKAEDILRAYSMVAGH